MFITLESFNVGDSVDVILSGPNVWADVGWTTLINSRTQYPLILLIPFITWGVVGFRSRCARTSVAFLPGEALACFVTACYPGSIVAELVFQNITPRCLQNELVLIVFALVFLFASFVPIGWSQTPGIREILRFGFTVDFTRYSLLTLERICSINSTAAVWSTLVFAFTAPLIQHGPHALAFMPGKMPFLRLAPPIAYVFIQREYFQCASLAACSYTQPHVYMAVALATGVIDFLLETAPKTLKKKTA